MIVIRKPGEIYQIEGEIQNGTFHGRWHFSFGDYYDPSFERFGTLRVFNDDTLSPGAVWPLHPHQDNEVVTYCAGGEFRHADERGKGGVLKKGWVQHTTVGRGMWHSEINNRPDEPMRFIQMWFLPAKHGLDPSVEQKAIEQKDRTGLFLPLVSNTVPGALRIVSDAAVSSSFLTAGQQVTRQLAENWGSYLYVLEGGPVLVNGKRATALSSFMITDEKKFTVRADQDAELLLAEVRMDV
ncbi:MAG: Pirin domain protein [Nitrospirae bacterium]|nr:Pirin domain protein [Nitrospirota bacterium]